MANIGKPKRIREIPEPASPPITIPEKVPVGVPSKQPAK